jgi:hypothetical protein
VHLSLYVVWTGYLLIPRLNKEGDINRDKPPKQLAVLKACLFYFPSFLSLRLLPSVFSPFLLSSLGNYNNLHHIFIRGKRISNE